MTPDSRHFAYWHDQKHVAFSYNRELVSGDTLSSEEVSWPTVRVFDQITCGTCGHQFTQAELRPPTLALHDGTLVKPCTYALYARTLFDPTYAYLVCTREDGHPGPHSLGAERT